MYLYFKEDIPLKIFKRKLVLFDWQMSWLEEGLMNINLQKFFPIFFTIGPVSSNWCFRKVYILQSLQWLFAVKISCRVTFWVWEYSQAFLYKLIVIASSLYPISVYENFHRNTLLSGRWKFVFVFLVYLQLCLFSSCFGY